MIYASGRYDDVNASTTGNLEFVGGPGYFYGGHTREGIAVPRASTTFMAPGMGAAPHRDGVNTGGHMNIPSAGISDIERIEMQYPFLYFTRSHNRDGSGFGQYRGGMGSYRIYLIYGSKDCSVDYKPYGGVAQGGFGLSGGYPTGIGANRVMIEAGLEMLDKVRKGEPSDGPSDARRGMGQIVSSRRRAGACPASGRKLAGRLRRRRRRLRRSHRPRSASRAEGFRPRLGEPRNRRACSMA